MTTASPGGLAVATRGLTKRFSTRTVVDHLDIAIPAGSVCGFVGPNGAGKTTTIRMLLGLIRPTEGTGTVLGQPLTNPADAPNILMGVFHPDLVGIQVRALQRLGAEHAVVVYGRDGMDEVSLGAATMVGEYKDGGIREYEIHPEDFGLTMASNRALKVDSPEQSKTLVRSVLDNEPGPARDIVILNAGVALYAANVVGTMAEGVAMARDVIASGKALAKMHQFVARTKELLAASQP